MMAKYIYIYICTCTFIYTCTYIHIVILRSGGHELVSELESLGKTYKRIVEVGIREVFGVGEAGQRGETRR